MKKTFIALLFLDTTATAAEPPETILSFFYPKEGNEAKLEQAIRENVAILKKLDVIEPSPIILARGTDAHERTYFVQMFTWRSASTPDNAPPEIKKSWAILESLVEPRDGKRGIAFEAVELVK